MRLSPRLLTRVVPLLLILALVGLQWWRSSSPGTVSSPRTSPAPGSATTSTAVGVDGDPGSINAALSAAARAHASGVEVTAAGRVTRLLADDTRGSRHQRFLVRVADSLTILVVHNRDLAPRVPVRSGDSLTLRGEYMWNERGGMVHWTHQDPAHRHEPGWIEYRGRRYQ